MIITAYEFSWSLGCAAYLPGCQGVHGDGTYVATSRAGMRDIVVSRIPEAQLEFKPARGRTVDEVRAEARGEDVFSNLSLGLSVADTGPDDIPFTSRKEAISYLDSLLTVR